MDELNKYKQYFSDMYDPYKSAKYISIYMIRECQSSCSFVSDTKNLIKVDTDAGRVRKKDFCEKSKSFKRVIIPKRKQIAMERRSGRELLRSLGLLKINPKKEECGINKNMCGECFDCLTYGYGLNGSRASKIYSEESYSIHPYDYIVTEHKNIGVYENRTMYNEESEKYSQSLFSFESVKPTTLFLDVQTLVNVSKSQFLYILLNILRTRRYGSVTSKMGKIKNHIVAIQFSNSELFSNMEWVKETYDNVCFKNKIPDKKVLPFPYDFEEIHISSLFAIKNLNNNMMCKIEEMDKETYTKIEKNLQEIMQSDKELKKIFDVKK